VLASDVTILCLPDDAAREVAAWASEAKTRVIDASTAHRIADGWVYGLPELSPGQRDAIRAAKYVSNPGCYAGSFLLLTRPLYDLGLLSNELSPTIHALSGYTGGGHAMIERWESGEHRLLELCFEVPYALGKVHKHVPEMMRHSGLGTEPQFLPNVGPFACGMRVAVELPVTSLSKGANAERLWMALSERYREEPFVRVQPLESAEGGDERRFDPRVCNDTNRIELHVLAHPSGHVVLMAISDNLGKGASGTALQSLNLMLGVPETTGIPGVG
jgi:N-acetyl-gamma-glutamyl-phosphate reductase